MKIFREYEINGIETPPPYSRVLKILASPWTIGTKNLWLAVSKVNVGGRSNAHSHEKEEEIFYIVSGRGKVIVGDEECKIDAGSCIYIPKNTVHQLINTGDETLKVLAICSPPFSDEEFRATHKIEKEK
ncbi:MAG: cupin domain-containing protein [Nitrososphaeria archaeon]|nr:cupin domain-containing protein [Nitrososphaeria archaeon]NIQ34130.1 cupin domain-containing protein [Nitrososphaeria archaeon]